MHSLISYSKVTIVEEVIYSSVLTGTAAAHFQDDLSSRRSFVRHCTQIYLLRGILCLDENWTPNKSTSRTVEEEMFPYPNGIT